MANSKHVRLPHSSSFGTQFNLTSLSSIVSIGAWVVVLAIVIDPFAQQLLSFNPGLTYQSDNSTQIPIARRWSQGIETVEEATCKDLIKPFLRTNC